MPRKSRDEVIAALEAKLEEAKSKTAKSRSTRIEKLGELIEKAKEREQKASAAVLKLEEERDALLQESNAGVYTNTTTPEFVSATADANQG